MWYNRRVTDERKYVPWREKHKAPHGFGSHCPDLPDGLPAQLLHQAIPDPAEGSGRSLYAVHGEWCFEAHQHADGTYHGFPRPGAELDERVLRALEQAGLITRGKRNRLRRQKQLPERP